MEAFAEHGGSGLLSRFSFSPFKLLQSVFSEHNWMLWRFKVVPQGYWESVAMDVSEQKQILDWLAEVMCLKCEEDWYRLSSWNYTHRDSLLVEL